MPSPIHPIFGRPLDAEVPYGHEEAVFGMGCYWGVERLFWQQPGVWMTEVGFADGTTPQPTYAQVCGGGTGHAEVVRVVYDPARISYAHLLRLFWENHDPTQGNRQGNDIGDQYRSIILTTTASQAAEARAGLTDYDNRLSLDGYAHITTQIKPLDKFWPAPEVEHQQYLHKVPHGYCALRGTGVKASTGETREAK